MPDEMTNRPDIFDSGDFDVAEHMLLLVLEELRRFAAHEMANKRPNRSSSKALVASAGSAIRSLNNGCAPIIDHISASPRQKSNPSVFRRAAISASTLALTLAVIITQAASAPPDLVAETLPSSRPGGSQTVPRLWDDAEWKAMTLPAARVGTRILYLSSEQYYKIPEEPAWKSYPVYAPDREPQGYRDRLKTLDPEIVFDASQPKTATEWKTAGEILFDTPFDFSTLDESPASDPEWWKTVTGIP